MPVREELQEGIRAALAGRRSEAVEAFRSVLSQDPLNEAAFLWLDCLIDDRRGRLFYLPRVLWAYLRQILTPVALWRLAVLSRSRRVSTRRGSRAGYHLSVHPLALGGLGLVCFLLGALLGPTLLFREWMEAPVAAMGLTPLHSTPQGTPVPPVPASPSPSVLATPAVPPTATAMPTTTPLPTPTPTSTPLPFPTPGFVVPSPFPTPGITSVTILSSTIPIPMPVQPVPVAADAVNIVVLGSDRRPEWSEWHTDAVHIVSVQAERGAVSVLSIPRDLYVYIPGFWMSRINFADFYGEAYGYPGGGTALVRDTILYNLGIRVDHVVRTNFDGLIGIVDTLGGVDIPVHCRLSDYWPYPDENGEYPIFTLEPGVHHLDGEQALWYARSRLTTSVFSRERRQQQVLQAIWRKVRDGGLLAQAPGLWGQVQGMVETDLTLGDVLDLVPVAFRLQEQNIRFYSIGRGEVTPWTTPYGGSVFLPRWEAIEPLVAEAMAPIPEARLSRTFLPVEVWNGTGNRDWDLLAADRLVRAGFPAVVGEPERRDYAQTELIVFSEYAKGTGVEYLQQMFRVPAERVVYEPDGSSPFGFRLIIGADYQTCYQW